MTESCIKQNRGFKKALFRSVPIAEGVGKAYKEISCVIHQGINWFVDAQLLQTFTNIEYELWNISKSLRFISTE